MPPDTIQQDHPVLVIAYDENSRATIVAGASRSGVYAIACASFVEAQAHALSGRCRGILVDLVTMIKAKDAEKVIAHTLSGLYPTLRVKSMGSMLIPMIMAGDAKQDKSLNDFFAKTCASFTPRKLRSAKRKEICIPTCIGTERGFTLNFSWSGVFIVDVNPERFAVGQQVSVRFLASPDSDFSAELTVVRLQPWGERHTPGIGMQFNLVDQGLEANLFNLLRSDKDNDPDRLST
jgi:hypothetical protein